MFLNHIPGYQKAKKIVKQVFKNSPQEPIPLHFLDNPRFQHKPLHLFKTTQGSYYLPADAHHDVIAACMKKGEIFEPEIVEVARTFTKKGTTVLDVGANFGQMSLLFADFVGDGGHVISFEADDYIFQILQKNIDVNQRHNIRAYLAAVYNTDGQVLYYPVQDFKRFSSYGSYGIDPNAKNGRTVETITIDSLNITTPISFMKVDVQGSDLFVLEGAIETIKKNKMPILFEFEQQFQDEFKTSFQDYLDFISSISYKVDSVINKINYLIVPDDRKRKAWISQKSDNIVKKNVDASVEPFHPGICTFLKTREEVDACTYFLHHNGFISHRLVCKDWDLAHIIPHIDDGNFLDMGSSDSYILKNVVLKGIEGKKYGIDLRKPDVPIKSVEYVIGDIVDTKLPDGFFHNITCLSVIEHEVDFALLAKEVSRLLDKTGKLFITFDYWEPKLVNDIKLYDLRWQPLDKNAVTAFIKECEKNNLYLAQDIDWTTKDPVIDAQYYAPHPDAKYTFGLLAFQKRC